MQNKKMVLITPPFTQLNTPYPATAYLKGFLETKNIPTFQIDLGIEVILDIFSKKGLNELFSQVNKENIRSENSLLIYQNRENYIKTINPVIKFLQSKNVSLTRRICSDNFLPKASRFNNLEDLDWAFGNMGLTDKAKHLATLYLEDISDFIVENIDPNFGFSRYAEKISSSANNFDELESLLNLAPSFIDQFTLSKLDEIIKNKNPNCIAFSIPFPGNLYSALRCGKYIKTNYPSIKVIFGGGFPNTELRSLKEVKVFNYVDYILLDDGEKPIEQLVHLINNKEKINSSSPLKRTYLLENNEVIFVDDKLIKDYNFTEVGTPNYTDLHLDSYLSIIEIANPMHSLWSDGVWNKMTMAHGCYWKKCTFCDISLNYIQKYEPATAVFLVDQMEKIMDETDNTGFHFVDEAAPPSLMKALALEIIKRKLVLTWWTNVRFEKSFSYDLCALLNESGCIAVSGGLEVASNRLLKLINKGVTVEQVANVTSNFTKNGIMVHSYLMYGFPTQTEQETIDSLELVRQLFELKIVQSGFWHRFALTAHSPIGLNPEEYNVIPQKEKITFADNEVSFVDKTNIDHAKFGFGLKKSLYNYMHDFGFDFSLQEWFDFSIPKPTIEPNYIENCLNNDTSKFTIKLNQQIVWLGKIKILHIKSKSKKGFKTSIATCLVNNKNRSQEFKIEESKLQWLNHYLENSITEKIQIKTLKQEFEKAFINDDFELFWFSKPLEIIKNFGLLSV